MHRRLFTTIPLALLLAGGCSGSAVGDHNESLDGADGGSPMDGRPDKDTDAGPQGGAAGKQKGGAGSGGLGGRAGSNAGGSPASGGSGGADAGLPGGGSAGIAAAGASGGGAGTAAASGANAGGVGGSFAGPAVAGSGGANVGGAGGVAPMPSDEVVSVAFDAKSDPAIPENPFPVPVLLYKGGLANRNPNLVVTPIDIEYDVVEHPQAWPAWRRNAGGVELQLSGVWTRLPYTFETLPLSKGTTLAGTFQWVRDTVIGSDAAVKVIFRYRFKADGTFQSCKSMLTVVPAIPTIERSYEENNGTYAIDGYKLHLTREQTADEPTLSFFYDPTRPTRLWLGTNHYLKDQNDTSALCTVP